MYVPSHPLGAPMLAIDIVIAYSLFGENVYLHHVGVTDRACTNVTMLLLQVDKLEQSDAERSEKEETAEEKPLVFGKCVCTTVLALFQAVKSYHGKVMYRGYFSSLGMT